MKQTTNEDIEFLQKFFNNFETQIRFAKNKRIKPALVLEVPSNCHPDYNCIFCPKKLDEEKLLDLNNVKIKLEKNKQYKIDTLVLAGSNPLNHPQIIDILKVVSNYFENISTFGFVEKLKSDSFTKDIKNAGLTEISLPLYSKEERAHNKIVGKNNFKDTIESIANLKRMGIKTFIHSILLKDNIKTLSSTEDYVKNELKLPFIIIPFRPKKGLDKKDLIVGYSDMIYTLKNKGLSSLVGFPLCVQRKIQEKRTNSNEISSIMKLYILLQNFHKLKKCKHCNENHKCNGLFKPFYTNLQAESIIPF